LLYTWFIFGHVVSLHWARWRPVSVCSLNAEARHKHVGDDNEQHENVAHFVQSITPHFIPLVFTLQFFYVLSLLTVFTLGSLGCQIFHLLLERLYDDHADSKGDLQRDGQTDERQEERKVLPATGNQQRLELGDVSHEQRHVHQLVDEVPLANVDVRGRPVKCILVKHKDLL